MFFDMDTWNDSFKKKKEKKNTQKTLQSSQYSTVSHDVSGGSVHARSKFSYQRCGNGYTVVTALLARWSSELGVRHFCSHKGAKAFILKPMSA